eukprot:m.316582 g.316582  ORF g.316582 m.316582 type:complete len:292 (-) comp16504_c0_seq12:223-1098(-)
MSFFVGLFVSAFAFSMASNPNLKYMMTYDCNLTSQNDWITTISGDGASPSEMVAAHKLYPALQGMPTLPGNVFDRSHRTLFSGWKDATLQFAQLIAPGIKNGTFIGVFLGDEICCSGTPLSNLTSVADLLRQTLPTNAILYTNECSEMEKWPSVPSSLDYISIDFYDEKNTNGSAEVAKNKDFYNNVIFPKLQPHQGVLLVPGIFASDPVHCEANGVKCPLGPQADQVVIKLKEMFSWAQEETRIAGFNPWHYNNRSSPQLPGAYNQQLGAISMPTVVEQLRIMGQAIRKN